MSNYIFDVDGTLLDSYNGILESVMEVLNNNGYKMDKNLALEYILKYSVRDLLLKIEKENNISFKKTILEYKESRIKTQSNYKFMPNALLMIDELSKMESKLFIFTHKGEYINQILKDYKIENKFIEVIHAFGPNFTRKPSSDSLNYLIDKYGLDKNETYYVGDRPIDIECANNSGIKSIFYNSNNMDLLHNPTFRIKDLDEIIKIEEGQKKLAL